jgi:hypothetical protein
MKSAILHSLPQRKRLLSLQIHVAAFPVSFAIFFQVHLTQPATNLKKDES